MSSNESGVRIRSVRNSGEQEAEEHSGVGGSTFERQLHPAETEDMPIFGEALAAAGAENFRDLNRREDFLGGETSSLEK